MSHAIAEVNGEAGVISLRHSAQRERHHVATAGKAADENVRNRTAAGGDGNARRRRRNGLEGLCFARNNGSAGINK